MRLPLLLIGTLLVASTAISADDRSRVYGKITTSDGDVLEGLIRWDKNEASWTDILNGNKELDRKNLRKSKKYRDRKSNEGRVEIFGVDVGGSDNWSWTDQAESGIRMGRIKSIEVRDDDEAIVTLKGDPGDDAEVILTGGSTDIGTDIREIIIEDKSEGEVELTWDDIDRVDFLPTPSGLQSSLGERLYGTLTTRRGDKYTGYVCWDVDEVLTKDKLEGEDRDRERGLRFERIAAISRYSSSAAEVELKGGEKMVLRGSNDVDESNRGILIGDPGFGQVEVPWNEFDRLDLTSVPASGMVTYESISGYKRLRGTVATEDGETFTGTIRWDNDEEFNWETLDGNYRDLQFDIELGLVKSIEKASRRGSRVTVWDGRTFELRGSNDVDDDNKGIFVTTDSGDLEEILWEDFERVEFIK